MSANNTTIQSELLISGHLETEVPRVNIEELAKLYGLTKEAAISEIDESAESIKVAVLYIDTLRTTKEGTEHTVREEQLLAIERHLANIEQHLRMIARGLWR